MHRITPELSKLNKSASAIKQGIFCCPAFLSNLFLSAVVLSTLSLSACDRSADKQAEQQQEKHDYSIFTFGTLVDISLYGVSRDQADEAFEQLQKDFDHFHQHWSPWTDGDLARLNRQLESLTPAVIPDHLKPLIETSMTLSQQSDHYYNPTIGKLINLWQFHRYQEDDIRPPSAQKIQALVEQQPRMSDLGFDDQDRLINTNPAISLNFGAYAKGYAIALEIEKLRRMGIENAVINAGGDLSVIGQHGERAWNIGIRHPRNDRVLASVEVKDNESVFTSGDYERFYHYQEKRYHHILDPNTGYPTTDTQSITVIHHDAGLADAAATALFVAGSTRWKKIAKNMDVRYVMLIDASGDIHMTPAMEKRIKLLNKSPTSSIILSEEL